MGTGRRQQRRRLWLAQGKLCPWCGILITAAEMLSPELTDRDHVVPKSHGGEGRLWNLQLLHRACNMEKGDWCPGCGSCQPGSMTVIDAAAELAEMAGVTLAAGDLTLLKDSMRMGEDGRWAALEVTVPDSAALLLARQLAGIFLLGERVLVAAGSAVVLNDTFRRLRDTVAATSTLNGQVKRVSSANGSQSLALRGGGAAHFTSLTGGRGHAADLLIINADPVKADDARSWLLPMVAARPNPQVWYVTA